MTTNSKVLALKYRPVNLQDLIGQDVIAQTIYNSIKLNKIPNAFLFHGIRGTGFATREGAPPEGPQHDDGESPETLQCQIPTTTNVRI